jgi:hypothetical protein
MFPLAFHVPFADQSLILCGFAGFGVIFSAIAAYFVSDALAVIPAEHQKNMTPGQVWLLVIPVFGLVWNFFVYHRVALSFQAYFESNGRPQPGDYGKQMGLIYSILAACSIVPCVGSLAGIAALVIVILLIVKFQEYKKMIISGGGSAFPVVPLPEQH